MTSLNFYVASKAALLIAVVVLSSFSLATQASAQLASKQQLEEVFSNTADYILVKGEDDEEYQLFDINNLESPFAKIVCRSLTPHPVLTDYLLVNYLPEFKDGLASYPPNISKPDDKESAKIRIEGWKGHWVGHDFVHCFAIKDGDIWLSQIDWEKRALVNERRITQIGQFDSEWRPVIWARTSLYFKHRQSGSHIKVSLIDGSVESGITFFDPQTESMLVSPDARTAVIVSNELIKIVDLESSESRLISNVVKYKHPFDAKAYLRHVVPIVERQQFKSNSHWISATQLVVPRLNGLVALDVESSSIKILPLAKKPRNYVAENDRYGAGDDTKFSLVKMFESSGVVKVSSLVNSRSVQKLALVDFASGQKVGLPESAKGATWLSSNSFVYSTASDDEAGAGTWFYQVKPERKIKLADEGFRGRMRVLLTRDRKKLFANLGTSKSRWIVCDIDTEDIAHLPQFEMASELGALGSPVQLSIGNLQNSMTTSQPVFSKGSRNEPLEKTERMEIAELIATMPFEIRKDAWNAYEKMKHSSNVRDPFKTLEFIKSEFNAGTRRRGLSFDSSWLASNNHASTINLDRCRFWAFEKCVEFDLSRLLSETRRRTRTPEEVELLNREFTKVADKFVEQYKVQPNRLMRHWLTDVYGMASKVRRDLNLDHRE